MDQARETGIFFGIRASLQRLMPKRHDELGRERGQAVLRVVVSLFVLGYLITQHIPVGFALVAYIGLAMAVMTFTLRARTSSVARRVGANIADAAAISYVMIIAGDAGIPLFLFYLWITVGNGLRFGVRAMTLSAALCVIGFSTVLALSPVWALLTPVAVAVMIALVLLPFSGRLMCGVRGGGVETTQGAERSSVTDKNTPSELPSLRGLRALILPLGHKRLDELGRERGQATVRLVNSLLVLAYLLISFYPLDMSTGIPGWLVFLGGFIALSFLLLFLTSHDIGSSVARRLAGNIADIGAVTYGMIATGKIGIPLFILYLSVTLGNGFRFGHRAMVISATLSVMGFLVVLALSPTWQEIPGVVLVIMFVLVVLPFSGRFARAAAAKQIDATADSGHLTSADGSVLMPPLSQRLRALMTRFGRKRLDELGREQGQATVRLANSLLVLLYFGAHHYFSDFNAGYVDWVYGGGFVGFSALLFVLALRDSTSSIARRIVGNLGDVNAISYGMIATGATGIPLFILYLSVTLGNGFRFGLRAMITSAILCVLGFSAVVVLSPVWHELPVTVPIAVMLSLILLPGYAAHLIHQLARATKRAEEASAAKSRFLARMSHELRTPLNGILGTTELLGGSKRLTREDRSLLDIIRDSVKISMRQIDNVLDFSKIEAGKLTIEQVNFDLHALLNRAVRLVRATALEKNLRLTLRIDPAIPYRLIGDPHHLHEVLLNLLSNAIKFTDKGYVSLEAHSIYADQASALVRFEVYDTGIGIEPNAVARIFEAFTQEDSGTTRRYGGTGLGTTIAKQLVELMGGTLHVESTKGKGSRFYADVRFTRQTPDVDISDTVLTGLRVLLISKELDLHEGFGFLASDWNVSLSAASSTAEAIGLLARGIRLGNPINVVLADSRAVFTASGDHCAADFLDKAWLSSTPVFLISDVSPEETQLREWGYAAVLSYSAPRTTLYSALRSSNADDSMTDQGVVHVEPWAWRQQTGRFRPRLLIADDNHTNLMILRKILEGAGYEIETAENGEKALEMMLHGRYKAAVVDMHMPGLDGIEVIRQYRMMHSGARMPLIMLTANATMDAKLESAEAGADAYLTKPATAAVLVSTIKKLLEDREVYELKRTPVSAPLTADVPILDAEVVAELDRLYSVPEELSRLLDTFEAEGGRLFRDLESAVAEKNHQAFCNLIHALKGNGANVGATRLAQVCLEIENAGSLDFHRDGRRLVSRAQDAFAEAVRTLRDHTGTGQRGPVRGSDVQ